MEKFMVLDGGMGHELRRIGAPFSQPYWSAQALLEGPEFVKQAHQNFIDAGAEVITVSSYACVPFHLGEEIYQEKGLVLAEKAAQIAREVADEAKVLVAGSLPPVFGSYRPDLFEKEVALKISQDLFRAQDAYVDLWITETVASIDELMVMHEVLSQSNKPTYYSFTLADEAGEKATLRSGETLEALFSVIKQLNIKNVLFNCSMPEFITVAIKETKELTAGTDITFGAYANSFTAIKAHHEANRTSQGFRELSPEDYLAFAQNWYDNGARIIGGCCGIYPQHIKMIADWKK